MVKKIFLKNVKKCLILEINFTNILRMRKMCDITNNDGS